MPINNSPVIPLFVGGPPVQVNVECLTGPGGDQPDAGAQLFLPNPDGFANVAKIALHPTNPRAVVVTPAATGQGGGPVALLVNEVGGATVALQVNVTAAQPPNVRQVAYVSHGPVQL